MIIIIIIIMKLHEPIQTRKTPKRTKQHPSFPPTATPWQRFSEEKSPPTYLPTYLGIRVGTTTTKPPKSRRTRKTFSLSLSMSRTMKEYLSFSCQEGAYLPLPPPMIEEVRKAAAPREDERRAREQRGAKRERQSLSTTYLPTYLPTFDLPCSHPPFLSHIGSKQREREGRSRHNQVNSRVREEYKQK